MRMWDWSSDVCSSDLNQLMGGGEIARVCRNCDSGYPRASEKCIQCGNQLMGGGEIARVCRNCDSGYPRASEKCIQCGNQAMWDVDQAGEALTGHGGVPGPGQPRNPSCIHSV